MEYKKELIDFLTLISYEERSIEKHEPSEYDGCYWTEGKRYWVREPTERALKAKELIGKINGNL